MILKVTEKDTKEAVVYWLMQTKGIEVAPDKLRPMYETEESQQYEGVSVSNMVGFEFDFDPAVRPPPREDRRRG